MSSSSISDFIAVAKLIDSDPPKWLIEFLESWSSSVMLDNAIQSSQPTRAQMLKQMHSIERAAAELLALLPKPAVQEFLNDADRGPTKHSGDFLQALRDVHKRSKIVS